MADRHTILVIEDDPDQLDMLARRLERFGFTVARAGGGANALHYLRTHPVDLVLLDQMMPDMTGIEVLRRVRLKYSSAALPVVMVTAASDTATVLDAASLGANDFITKPVDVHRVLERIRHHLAHKA